MAVPRSKRFYARGIIASQFGEAIVPDYVKAEPRLPMQHIGREACSLASLERRDVVDRNESEDIAGAETGSLLSNLGHGRRHNPHSAITSWRIGVLQQGFIRLKLREASQRRDEVVVSVAK